MHQVRGNGENRDTADHEMRIAPHGLNGVQWRIGKGLGGDEIGGRR